mgnify:CR=1 FL=1|jgi:glutamyl/glutaminyl-tRNA synthetase
MEVTFSGGCTRLAPTPSGFLHAGNAINFLITDRLARAAGARLRLRIDDLDAERVRPPYLEDVFLSLAWLGIVPDEGPVSVDDHQRHWSQQARIPRYQELLDRLRVDGHLYACTCSRKEMSVAPCGCRTARKPFNAPDTAWRLHVPDGTTARVEELSGDAENVRLDALMPDPVVRQRNGRPAYQIASLADDVDHGITFIVRGMDLQPSTACQLYLARLLGLERFLEVRFLHHPLAVDDAGKKLSKSEGASSLKAMREAGRTPDELVERAERVLNALRPS